MDAKIHWAFADAEKTMCGLSVVPIQDPWWNAKAPETTTSRPDVTCRGCLKHNPGSASKERAWHRVRRGEGFTDCGMRQDRMRWESVLHKTYKDPEVTCGRCLRSMRVRRRAA